MSFLNYIFKAQVEFETKLGHKASMILIPCWRMDEILNESQKHISYDKQIIEFLYLQKQRINGLDIIWSSSQDYIELI